MRKIIFFTIVAVSLGVSTTALAQTAAAKPKVIITWIANSYAPPTFGGKVLPTAGSLVSASVALLDGGRLIDLSKETIYWYLDNNFLSGGPGLRGISFRAPDVAGGTVSLRAEIPNYSKGSQLKTISIPVASPEAVIEIPFPSKKFYSSSIKLVGQPYFFNIGSASGLNFSWSINGQTPSGAENPQSLNIKIGNLAVGSSLSVSLVIQNVSNQFERGAKSENILYSQ